MSSRQRSTKTDSCCSSSETLSSRSSKVAMMADGGARRRARDVHHRINDDEGGERPPIFNHASQNVTAATMLVHMMPEPSTIEGRRVHGELRDLLETVVVQQAKSSASRRRGDTSK